MIYDCIIVGAGLTGLTAARCLADKGKKVLVIEQTNRIGGLCKEGHFKGTRFSIYGAHLFHTDNKEVWDFLSRFTDWTFYTHFVKSYCKGKLWSVPIDYNELGKHSEWHELLLKEYLYNDYNKKMWGNYYDEIQGHSIKRLNTHPFDHRYFSSKYQAFPASGYDEMFMRMIDNKNIAIHLNSTLDIFTEPLVFDWARSPVIYTGRIDHLLDRSDLPFMTMGFETVLNGDFPWSDEYGVVNFPQDFDFIRAHSSKILYKQDTKNDVVVYDYPRRNGPECYPLIYNDSVRLWQDIDIEVNKKYPNIIPAGRAGLFKHLDMDQAVESGLKAANIVLERR